MATKRVICPTLLRQLIQYDPETGAMHWKPRTLAWFKHMGNRAQERCAAWNASWAGKPALTFVSRDGYLRGRLRDVDLRAHRVAFAITYGRFPAIIDHKNHNRADNRICNLREATQTENARNRSAAYNSTSKYLGVFWNKRLKAWTVRIKHEGRHITVGHFASETIAAQSYDDRARELFGEFANLNFG